MSTRQKALDALADIEHQASGGLEIDSALFRTVRAALSAPAERDGWQLVPVEPTEAMWSAGRDPVMFRELKHYRPASLPVPAWQMNPDGTVEKDTSKGTTAVHVWRAMLAAAPRPAPAEPQPIAAWSIVRTAESAVVTAVRAALSAAPAPQPAGGDSTGAMANAWFGTPGCEKAIEAVFGGTQPAGGEREAFEAWCFKRGQDYERLGNGYTNGRVQRMWQGWQARADISQPAAQQEPVPEGYMLVLVPKESPGGKPDWDECIRQSEVATGLKVDRNTFSIIKREVRRWLAQCHASQPAEEQAGERKPLTEAQIDRHSIAAVDCPPSSTVILVSSLRRLLNTKGDGHD